MSIAAIVPVYNRPRAVLEALDSITAQTVWPNVLVVVDDGSADDTASSVENWIRGAPPGIDARLVRQSNQGPAVARNRGVADATGCDILAFLDSDDLWPDDYLQRVQLAFQAEPHAVAVTCDRQDIYHGTNKVEFKRLDKITRHTPTRLVLDGPPGTPNTVIRAEVFHAVGGYDPTQRCGEDYQLMLRISLCGKWIYQPGRPVTVRHGLEDHGGHPQGLAHGFPDRRYRLAKMLERFFLEEGGDQKVPGRIWRRRLGRLWYTAGRQMIGLGRQDQAYKCFRRSIAIWPWHLRARLRTLWPGLDR